MDHSQWTGLALFAGIGGLELGVKLALGDHYRLLGCVEREAFSAAVLLARMEDETLDRCPIWCGSLEDADLGPFVDRIDILTAGFPCQPWSPAGAKRGVDDDRWIWPLLAAAIRRVRPGFVFLENVPGLAAGGLEHVLGDLAEMGFDAEWGQLGAWQVGQSHRRDRLWILAYDDRERLEQLGQYVPQPVGRDTDGRCANVGHTSGERRSAHAGRVASAQGGAPGWAAEGDHVANRPGEGVGDPDGSRWGEGVRPGHPAGRAGTGGPHLQLAPPGRDDIDGWRRALERDPNNQPAVLRVAHGAPGWVDAPGGYGHGDRLRAVGNAVAPSVAAAALVMLIRQALED